MSYVIATTKSNGETLFMVDRRVQKKSFWSNRLDDVFVYTNAKAAYLKKYSLRYNNPHVLTLETARKIEREQMEIKHEEEIYEEGSIAQDDSLLIAGTKE